MPIGAAVGLAGVAGAGAQIFSANKAAGVQQQATQNAANIAQENYQTTRSDLAPYRDAGSSALSDLTNRLPFLTSPITMDQATLEQTPGYQFTLTQGEKAVQNAAAARGLGSSGAALKGAATFATGLADQTYKDQFNLENTNRQNAYDRLMGVVNTGAGAANATGTFGTAAANTTASAAVGGGNAAAAGINATGNAINNLTSNVAGYAAYRGLYGTGGSAPGAPGYYGGTPATNFNLA